MRIILLVVIVILSISMSEIPFRDSPASPSMQATQPQDPPFRSLLVYSGQSMDHPIPLLSWNKSVLFGEGNNLMNFTDNGSHFLKKFSSPIYWMKSTLQNVYVGSTLNISNYLFGVQSVPVSTSLSIGNLSSNGSVDFGVFPPIPTGYTGGSSALQLRSPSNGYLSFSPSMKSLISLRFDYLRAYLSNGSCKYIYFGNGSAPGQPCLFFNDSGLSSGIKLPFLYSSGFNPWDVAEGISNMGNLTVMNYLHFNYDSSAFYSGYLTRPIKGSTSYILFVNSNLSNISLISQQKGNGIWGFSIPGTTNMKYLPHENTIIGSVQGNLSIINLNGSVDSYPNLMHSELNSTFFNGYEWFVNGSHIIQGVNFSTMSVVNFTEPAGVSDIVSMGNSLFLSNSHEIFQNVPTSESVIRINPSYPIPLNFSMSFLPQDNRGNMSSFEIIPNGNFNISIRSLDPRFAPQIQSTFGMSLSRTNLSLSLSGTWNGTYNFNVSFFLMQMGQVAASLNQSSDLGPVPEISAANPYILVSYNLTGTRHYSWIHSTNDYNYTPNSNLASWDISLPSGYSFLEISYPSSSWQIYQVSKNFLQNGTSLAFRSDLSISFFIGHYIKSGSSSGNGGSSSSPGSQRNSTGIWRLLGFSANPPDANIGGIGQFFSDAAYFYSGVGGRAIYGMIMFIAAFYYLLRINEHYAGKKTRSTRGKSS